MAVPYVTKIRTESGDAQIDYNALANQPKSDASLSIEGRFADAQATGKKLADIVKNIDDMNTTLETKISENAKKLDDELAKKVDKSGGNMSDILNMNGFSITNLQAPVNASDAVNKEFVDNKETSIMAEVSKKAETDSYSATFSDDEWIYDDKFYMQSVTVPGVLSSDNPLVDINLSDVSDHTSVIENWTLVGRVVVTADNRVVAYCYEDKPEIDIPIILKVVR